MKDILKGMFTNADEEMEEEYYDETEELDVTDGLKNINRKTKAIVNIFEPSSYRQAGKVMDLIEQNQVALIITTKLDQSETQRLIDVIHGSLYSLRGEIREIAPNTYLCVPKVIKIEEPNILGE